MAIMPAAVASKVTALSVVMALQLCPCLVTTLMRAEQHGILGSTSGTGRPGKKTQMPGR